jgi:uncharacterized integral membrane protein
MGCMCNKCSTITGLILLVLGIVFLLKDYDIVAFKATFWSIAAVAAGIVSMASSKCPDCCSVKGMGKGKR